MRHFMTACLLIVTAIGVGLPAQAELTSQVEFAPFHPQCLEAFYSFSDEEADGEIICDPADFTSDVEVRTDDGGLMASSAISAGGYLYYRLEDSAGVAGSGSSRYYLLSAGMNGGGSGVFATVFMVLFDTATNKLQRVLSIPAGDRCNDGYVSDLSLQGHRIRWNTAATPFRLLNPVSIRDERMARLVDLLAGAENEENEFFLGWEPYDDVGHSASSCVGSIRHEHDLQTATETIIGVTLTLNADWGAWPQQTQGSQAKCLAQWRPGPPYSREVGSIEFGLDEWLWELRGLARECR